MTDINWFERAPDTGSPPTRDFFLRHAEGEVPGALWLPAKESPKALILVGHGGSRHKRESTKLTFIAEAVEQNALAVVAIDGSVHGERRSDRSGVPGENQNEFLDL